MFRNNTGTVVVFSWSICMEIGFLLHVSPTSLILETYYEDFISRVRVRVRYKVHNISELIHEGGAENRDKIGLYRFDFRWIYIYYSQISSEVSTYFRSMNENLVFGTGIYIIFNTVMKVNINTNDWIVSDHVWRRVLSLSHTRKLFCLCDLSHAQNCVQFCFSFVVVLNITLLYNVYK